MTSPLVQIHADAIEAAALLRQLSPNFRNRTECLRLVNGEDDPTRLWQAILKVEAVIEGLTREMTK